MSGADDSHADYDGKGIKLRRGNYLEPKVTELLKWPQAAKRVQQLIDQGMYLKAGDYSRMPGYEREALSSRIIRFYSRLPKEIERPFQEDLLNEDARKRLPELLEEPETAEELVSQMDTALAALPLDFPAYDERAEILSVIHDYIEGIYTIFPDQKTELEVEGAGRQLSLFDFMGGDVPEEEPQEVTEEPTKEAEVIPEAETVLEVEAEQPEPMLTEEEQDAVYTAIEGKIESAIEKAGVSFDLFSPEQMDVIYDAAEKGQDVTPALNPGIFTRADAVDPRRIGTSGSR